MLSILFVAYIHNTYCFNKIERPQSHLIRNLMENHTNIYYDFKSAMISYEKLGCITTAERIFMLSELMCLIDLLKLLFILFSYIEGKDVAFVYFLYSECNIYIYSIVSYIDNYRNIRKNKDEECKFYTNKIFSRIDKAYDSLQIKNISPLFINNLKSIYSRILIRLFEFLNIRCLQCRIHNRKCYIIYIDVFNNAMLLNQRILTKQI